MSKPRIDLSNKSYGKLRVLKFDKYFNNNARWICKCECGNIKSIPYSTLWRAKNNENVTCGCSHRRSGNLHPSWQGYGEISLFFWNNIKSNSRKKHRDFNISIEYAWKLFLEQNRKCILSGLEIKFDYPYNLKNRNITASLDRIDSNKGYIKGNVQWVHKDINALKSNFSQEKFIELCNLVSNNNRRNND